MRISLTQRLHPLPLGLQLTYATGVHTLSHLRANAGTPTPAAVHWGEAAELRVAPHAGSVRCDLFRHQEAEHGLGLRLILVPGGPSPRGDAGAVEGLHTASFNAVAPQMYSICCAEGSIVLAHAHLRQQRPRHHPRSRVGRVEVDHRRTERR